MARSLNQSIEPATLSMRRWATAFVSLLPFACRAAWAKRAAILYVGIGASLASYARWNSGVAAFLFLGEPMGLIHLVSAGCILSGIVLATR